MRRSSYKEDSIMKKLKFSVMGIQHGHIYGMCADLIKAGGELVSAYDKDEAARAEFAKRYPEIDVILDLPDEFITIPMDAILIEQVAINILENAVQHAKGMTELILKVYTKSNKAFFEIKDNGCGISKDRLKNIFDGYCSSEAFIPDSTKNNAGIGLSVCATIIKAHDGEISVESSKNGTLFRFVLAMEESDNE